MGATLHIPDGEHHFRFTCQCGKTVDVTALVRDNQLAKPVRLCCSCGQRRVVDLDFRVFTPGWYFTWKWVLRPLIPVFAMLLLIDQVLWRGLNRTSEWLQGVTGLSKYHLVLAAFVAGLLMLLIGHAVLGKPLVGIALTTLWALITHDTTLWCVRKIQSGADEGESEVLDAAEVRRISTSRATRFLYVLMAGSFLPILPMLFDPFPYALFLFGVGFYWLDSTFVPPSRRWVRDLFRSWVPSQDFN